MNTLLEYIKIHLISLEQDSEELQKQMGFYNDLDSDEYRDLEIEDVSLNGQIMACHHFLSVADDMILS